MNDRSKTPAPAAARKPRRLGSGGATVHDVARLAGVSIITVSRSVNTPHRVSPETLKRVQDAVARTHYVPNLMAGGLRSARSRLVVALVPTLSSQLFDAAIQSLTETLDARGYQLMLGQIGYVDSREDRLLDAIIGRRPDGIVLTGILHSADGRRRLLASGIPVVETWDYTPTPIDMLVGFSHERVGDEVADFLIGRGRSKLALISGDDERAMRRRDGFLRAASRAGVAAPQVRFVPAPASHASGRSALAELLAEQPDTDAVFCSSDLLAMGVLTEAQVRGLAVPGATQATGVGTAPPGGLAIVGFGDLDFAATLAPALTSVRVDGARLGRLAAEFVIDRSEGTPQHERVVDIGFTIVVRDSA